MTSFPLCGWHPHGPNHWGPCCHPQVSIQQLGIVHFSAPSLSARPKAKRLLSRCPKLVLGNLWPWGSHENLETSTNPLGEFLLIFQLSVFQNFMLSTWFQLYLQYIKHPFAGVSFAGVLVIQPKTSEKQVEWAEHPKWPVGQAWVPAENGMIGMKLGWNGIRWWDWHDWDEMKWDDWDFFHRNVAGPNTFWPP